MRNVVFSTSGQSSVDHSKKFLSRTKEQRSRWVMSKRLDGAAVNLVEKIVRLRVLESAYWRQHCFALSAEGLVERAAELDVVGGVASETNKPTPFLCLLVKALQLKMPFEIAKAMLRQRELKYLRCLAALYIRLTARSELVFLSLEPLLNDWRKVGLQTKTGWELSTIDAFVDNLLNGTYSCAIALPRLAPREALVKEGKLKPWKSVLEERNEYGGDVASEREKDDDESLSDSFLEEWLHSKRKITKSKRTHATMNEKEPVSISQSSHEDPVTQNSFSASPEKKIQNE